MKTVLMIKFRANALAIFFLGEVLACRGIETNQFPSNEVEYSNANPKMIWGEVTNFFRGDRFGGVPLPTALRSAINVKNGVIVLSGDPLKVVNSVELYIENIAGPLYESPTAYVQGVPTFEASPTNVVIACMPPLDERLALTLTDTNGLPVTKTSEGRALNRPSSLKGKTRWSDLPRAGTGRRGMFSIFPRQLFQMAFSDKIGAGVRLSGQELERAWDFDPTRYFEIEKPGLYKLTIVQRINIEDTNSYLKTISLPQLTVNVRVE